MNLSTSVTESTDTREAQRPDATPDEVWAFVLDLWRFFGLDRPEVIGVREYGILQIVLPDNERGQVDRWAAALGLPAAGVRTDRLFPTHRGPATSYGPACPAIYGTHEQLPGWAIDLSCHMLLGVDASEHWSGPVNAATEEPERTLTSVEREILARATEGGAVLHDASCEDEPTIERIEIGADGCGCPISANHRVAGDGTVDPSWIDGSERTDHRAKCWNDAFAALDSPVTDAQTVSAELAAKAAEAVSES